MLEMRLLNFKKFVMFQTGVCSNAHINAYCCKKYISYKYRRINKHSWTAKILSTVDEGTNKLRISLLYANLYRHFVKCRLLPKTPHRIITAVSTVYRCEINVLKVLCRNNIKTGNYTASSLFVSPSSL
jgi:hypothetical protein